MASVSVPWSCRAAVRWVKAGGGHRRERFPELALLVRFTAYTGGASISSAKPSTWRTMATIFRTEAGASPAVGEGGAKARTDERSIGHDGSRTEQREDVPVEVLR